MRLPIRARLTAWYVALLAVIIVALSAFLVLRLRADLTADADRRLDTASMHIARAYEAEGFKDFRDVAGTVLPPGDAFARVVGPGGRVVAEHGAELPGVHYRTHFQTVERDGHRLTLVTAESLAPADRSVHRVLVLLLIGGPAALLVTAAGGWWLARKALAPVERMTDQADRMGAESLDARLEVPRTHDEVARLARTLNAMLERVERGVEDKRRLIADASHELRGPLAVMRSELDVALSDPALDGDARAVLASSRDEVVRMARMVDDLLTLAAIDEGRLELMQERVDLRAAAEHVALRLGPSGDRVAIDGPTVLVSGDSLRLEHALSNLVDNALKFGDDVEVSTWARDGEAGVTVTDDGPGIPAGERERVFERFVRLDAARGRGGSGLGLAICREVATAHGGRVWVEPAPGGGSRFVMALPGTTGSPQGTDPVGCELPAAN
jgi:signal transduction histidine kinase